MQMPPEICHECVHRKNGVLAISTFLPCFQLKPAGTASIGRISHPRQIDGIHNATVSLGTKRPRLQIGFASQALLDIAILLRDFCEQITPSQVCHWFTLLSLCLSASERGRKIPEASAHSAVFLTSRSAWTQLVHIRDRSHPETPSFFQEF
jgi:hypothetical protein